MGAGLSHVRGPAKRNAGPSSSSWIFEEEERMVRENEQEWVQKLHLSHINIHDPSHDTWAQEQLTALEMVWSEAINTNIKSLTEAAAPEKAMAVARLSQQGPPSRFRLIDCRATCEAGLVILVNGLHHFQDHYTAISHTWGLAVYDVFDCRCGSRCVGDAPPRSSSAKDCPGAVAGHDNEHRQVVADILEMCERLLRAGAEFIWHDGVCIAQYDKAELEESIRHMGWIYANSFETVIFLHSVGNPVGLLDPRVAMKDEQVRVQTRWNTRVWTLQEAILPKRRRYCIRRVDTRMVAVDASMSFTRNWVCFLTKLAQTCQDSSIAVIEEEEFWEQVLSLLKDIIVLHKQVFELYSGKVVYGHFIFQMLSKMRLTLASWINLMREDFFMFPSLSKVMKECALYRDSKWEGDRINSVLGLAGITDFVAPKDGDFKASTVKFLRRLGQQDLGEALFWINNDDDSAELQTWVPCLSRPFSSMCMHLRKGKKTVELAHKAQGESSDCNEIWCKTFPKEPEAERWLISYEKLGSEKNWPFSSSLLHLGWDKEVDWDSSSVDLVRYNVLKDGRLELRGTMLSIPVHFYVVQTEKAAATIWHSYKGSLGVCLVVEKSAAPKHVAVMVHPVNGMLVGAAVISSRTVPPSICTRPVVQGTVMEEGDSFRAHLILAEFHARERITCLRSLLIVTSSNGASELQSEVCRLGTFLATDKLIRVIRLYHRYGFTKIFNLLVVQ